MGVCGLEAYPYFNGAVSTCQQLSAESKTPRPEGRGVSLLSR
jgi:hypothetical protein